MYLEISVWSSAGAFVEGIQMEVVVVETWEAVIESFVETAGGLV